MVYKIGIISDTHNFLHPKVHNIFKKVNQIFHAGDYGSEDVIIELNIIAPVVVVSGNMDSFKSYPTTAFSTLYGKRIYITHNIVNPLYLPKYILDDIERLKPDIVIFGHTHSRFFKKINNIYFINPGCANPKLARGKATVAIAWWETETDPDVNVEFYELK